MSSGFTADNSFFAMKEDVQQTAQDIRSTAARAKAIQGPRSVIAAKLMELLKTLVKALWNFAKVAFTIALHKFALEFAAQAMTGVASSLANRFNKRDTVLSTDFMSNVNTQGGSPNFGGVASTVNGGRRNDPVATSSMEAYARRQEAAYGGYPNKSPQADTAFSLGTVF